MAFLTQKPPYRRTSLHELFPLRVKYYREVLGLIWYVYESFYVINGLNRVGSR